MENLFCGFLTNQTGICGKYLKPQERFTGRCSKHLGLKPIIKVKANRFRGNSKLFRDSGGFTGAKEN